MKVLIKKLYNALDHEPKQKTHLIKILMGTPEYDGFFKDISNQLYTPHKYVFADIDTPKPGEILFDEKIAEQIIQDFQKNKDNCLELLVVCMRGQNRSPAVAMALNEIFDLGEDIEHLKQKYPHFTQHVYNVMLKTAQKMGLGDFE